MPDTVIFVDLFQSAQNPLARVVGRPQRWRWTARNGLNGRVLAVSSENYTNRRDCLDAVTQLFGPSSNVYLRSSQQGNQTLRLAGGVS